MTEGIDREAREREAVERDFGMDWEQVRLNGGPPCFHEENGRLCGRAKHWFGHPHDHAYVSLAAFAQSCVESGPCSKNSPYHRPTSMYCLDCLPPDAPLGALLLSNRPPTQSEIERGQEIQKELDKRAESPVERESTSYEKLWLAAKAVSCEAWFVLSGGDDVHDKCPDCGMAGIGQLRANLKVLDEALQVEPTESPVDRAVGERTALEAIAGRILEECQDGEWCGIEWDGCECEELLVKAGMIEQIDVTESCGENCACEVTGFPGKCNRTTAYGAEILKRGYPSAPTGEMLMKSMS